MLRISLLFHHLRPGFGKDTPSVSASYVRFVLSQSNMGQVGTLAAENKELKRKLEETNDALKEVKRIASDAKKLADSATVYGVHVGGVMIKPPHPGCPACQRRVLDTAPTGD